MEALKVSSDADAAKKKRNAKFIAIMDGFHSQTDKTFGRLDSKFQEANKGFEELVVLYGEDTKTTSTEEFFGTFSQFRTAFILAKTENEEAIQRTLEAEKKAKEQQVRFFFVIF